MRAIGIDLGGSAVKWGVIDHDGQIRKDERIEYSDRSPAAVIELLQSLVKLGLDEWDDIAGIGIGSPGLIDKNQRLVRLSPNFDGWIDVPLAESLEKVSGAIPVFVENDANLLVYSETQWGAARCKSNVIVLTLGTGVGGGIMVDGKLVRGSNGGGAELGHLALTPDGPKCGCGSRGCLEAYCNINAVMRTAKEVYKDNPHPSTPLELAEAANAGDTKAIELWQTLGEWLGVGLASLVNIFNPELILIGGGLSGARELLLEPARVAASKRCYHANWQDVTISRAEFGEKSGIVGAAAMVFGLIDK